MKYFSLLFALAVLSPTSAFAANVSEVFERVWNTAKTELYPGSTAGRFDTATHDQLFALAANAHSLEELDPILNSFLRSLGVSHTHFYQDHDPDYYFMRSLFSTGNPDSHPLWQVGIQTYKDGQGERVREVLEGYPGDKAGLRRGDLLLACNGQPYHSFHCYQEGKEALLGYQRNGHSLSVEIQPIFEDPARSFIEAMKHSSRVIETAGKKIGYVHLWVGAFDENIQEYLRLVESQHDTDAMILDLRGGFGGASLDMVDPFYADRSTYATMSGISRDGKVSSPEKWDSKTNPNPYLKPLVVLIDEGVRSGKEMMAFQLKKGRATLLGSRTAGMFVGGRMWFSGEKEPYLLYLASVGALLDGINIEGVGVSPQREVPYPTESTSLTDPQLEAALAFLTISGARSEAL